jgi:hypothetical protein
MPESSCLPREEETRGLGRLADSDLPVQISPVNNIDGVWSGVDPKAALSALVSSKNALEATGMDSEALQTHLSAQWTAESAFRDCASTGVFPSAVAHCFVHSYGAAVKLRPFATRWHIGTLATCTCFDAYRKFVAAEFGSLHKRSRSHRFARRTRWPEQHVKPSSSEQSPIVVDTRSHVYPRR